MVVTLLATILQPDTSYLPKPCQENNVPGAVLLVQRQGETVHQEVYGVRKDGHPAPLELDDPMHLASVSKSFGGFQIALAAHQGKLDLDRPFHEYFPEDTRHPDQHPFTIRHLLHHLSGLPDFSGSLDFRPHAQGPLPQQRRAIVRQVLRTAPETEPGQAHAYRNVNYILLATLLEQAYETPWETLVKTQILTPLDLKTAGFGPTGKQDDDRNPLAPYQHRFLDQTPLPLTLDNPAYFGPSGSLHMSAPDLARWATLHLNGTLSKTAQIPDAFPKDQTFWQSLHRPASNGAPYGFGWVPGPEQLPGSHAFAHSGSNTMSLATVVVDPKTETVAVLMANAAPSIDFADKLLAEILQQIYSAD